MLSLEAGEDEVARRILRERGGTGAVIELADDLHDVGVRERSLTMSRSIAGISTIEDHRSLVEDLIEQIPACRFPQIQRVHRSKETRPDD